MGTSADYHLDTVSKQVAAQVCTRKLAAKLLIIYTSVINTQLVAVSLHHII